MVLVEEKQLDATELVSESKAIPLKDEISVCPNSDDNSEMNDGQIDSEGREPIDNDHKSILEHFGFGKGMRMYEKSLAEVRHDGSIKKTMLPVSSGNKIPKSPGKSMFNSISKSLNGAKKGLSLSRTSSNISKTGSEAPSTVESVKNSSEIPSSAPITQTSSKIMDKVETLENLPTVVKSASNLNKVPSFHRSPSTLSKTPTLDKTNSFCKEVPLNKVNSSASKAQIVGSPSNVSKVSLVEERTTSENSLSLVSTVDPKETINDEAPTLVKQVSNISKAGSVAISKAPSMVKTISNVSVRSMMSKASVKSNKSIKNVPSTTSNAHSTKVPSVTANTLNEIQSQDPVINSGEIVPPTEVDITKTSDVKESREFEVSGNEKQSGEQYSDVDESVQQNDESIIPQESDEKVCSSVAVVNCPDLADEGESPRENFSALNQKSYDTEILVANSTAKEIMVANISAKERHVENESTKEESGNNGKTNFNVGALCTDQEIYIKEGDYVGVVPGLEDEVWCSSPKEVIESVSGDSPMMCSDQEVYIKEGKHVGMIPGLEDQPWCGAEEAVSEWFSKADKMANAGPENLLPFDEAEEKKPKAPASKWWFW